MATRLEIPMPFLWKILRKLSEKKLVRSFKGVHGGYELARPARAIAVSEVLAAGRGTDQIGRCVLGLEMCDDRDPCPLHFQWKNLRKQIEARFKATTLADLVRDSKPAKKRRGQVRSIAERVAS
jgi:Rrf2 family protein